MNFKSVTIQAAIIWLCAGIIGWIIWAMANSLFAKNNEIETRLFELKIEAYKDIYDIVHMEFDPNKLQNEYLALFKKWLEFMDSSYNYIECANIDPSQCNIGLSWELKFIQWATSKEIIKRSLESSLSKIHRYQPIFPQSIFFKIKSWLDNTYEQVTWGRLNACSFPNDFEQYLEWEYDCYMGSDVINPFKKTILNILQEDIQEHYE